MGEKSSFGKKLFQSKFFLLAATVALVFFATGFLRSFLLDYQIRQETAQLKKIQSQLEDRKLKLLDKLSEIESDAYAEKEARLRLGLTKPGEEVVVIKDLPKAELVEGKVKEETRLGVVTIANPILWWQYFFTSSRH